MDKHKQDQDFLDQRSRPYMPSPEAYVDALGHNNGHDLPPRPPQQRHPVRNFFRVIGVLLLLICIVVVGYAAYLGSIVAKISTNPLDLSGLSADASGRTNVLVLGVGDPDHAAAKLTDTIMVISYSNSLKKIAQISVPRDLRVQIPGVGPSKINAANAYGGTQLARQTVSNTLDLPIDYEVQTDFTGLKAIVDAVGGIDVNVKQRLTDSEYPCDNNQYKVCGLDIMPGLQHMDGTAALHYVRCRKGTCGDDFGRAARQQEVLGLVRSKATQWQVLIDPRRLVPLVNALRTSLSTDMGTIQMLELARDWQQAQAAGPIQYVISIKGGDVRGAAGSSDLVPVNGSFTAIQSKVRDIFTTSASGTP